MKYIKYLLSLFYDFLKEKKYVLLFLLIFLSLIITYNRFFVDALNNYLVKPIAFYFVKGFGFYGNIALFLVCFCYYFRVFNKEKSIHYKRLFIVIIISVCLGLCQYSGEWIFYPINKPIGGFAYVDFVYILGVLEIIILLLHIKKQHRESLIAERLSLRYDIPILKEADDTYQREKYAKTIYETILGNFSIQGSFCVGIVGTWGSGKSSFMNLMKNHIEPANKIVSIDFNAWSANSYSEIINEFFGLYNKRVSPFCPGLSNKIDFYTEILINAINENAGNWYYKIKSLFQDSTSQIVYDEICEELKVSHVNVLIFIDDLDRLRDTEILEVLRLIRNTVNFPYTQFVVAYDKDYIKESLDNNQIANAFGYMEKIFNCEIYLPSCFRTNITDSLKESLKVFFSENNLNIEEIGLLLNTAIDEEIESEGHNLLIPSLLKTQRDVIRFSNSFIINLKYFIDNDIISEILIRDFFYLELIRFRYFQVYEKLRNTPLELLSLDFSEKRYVNRKAIEKVAVLTEDNVDNKIISENILINILLDKLFPQYGNRNGNSLANYRSFFKYFAYNLDPKCLMLSELLNAIEGDTTDSNVTSWISEKYSGEIQDRISEYVANIEISSRNTSTVSLDSFIQLYAFVKKVFNIPNPNMIYEVFEGISDHINGLKVISLEHLCKVLDLWFTILNTEHINKGLNDLNILMGILYKDNLSVHLCRSTEKSDYKAIWTSLYNSSSSIKLSPIINDFINQHDKSSIQDDNLVVPLVCLKKLPVLYLQRYTSNPQNTVTEDFFTLLYSCWDHVNPSSHVVSLNKTALKLARNFIERNPQGYLSLFIRKGQTSSNMWNIISPEPMYKQIFGNNELFVKFLNGDNLSSMVDVNKIRNYWKLYENNNYQPIEFNNQGLIDEIISSDFIEFKHKVDELLKIQKEVQDIISNETIDDVTRQKKLKEKQDSVDQLGFYIKLTGDIIQMINSIHPTHQS